MKSQDFYGILGVFITVITNPCHGLFFFHWNLNDASENDDLCSWICKRKVIYDESAEIKFYQELGLQVVNRDVDEKAFV
nr:unnamed protein product [Callosobruchus chinensis]